MSTTDTRKMRSVVIASVAGNWLEFYDYAIYGFLATTLSRVFFPESNAVDALLQSLAVFAIAFFARPVGGFFWGSLADRLGRQRVLVLTLLLVMVGTAGIGVLPGADAIGAWAPALLVLCRMIQGFSLGGETTTAGTYVIEHAPAYRRGLFGSLVTTGGTMGLLMGSGFVLVLRSVLSEAEMVEWGWRIPFLAAIPLGAIGLYIRLRLGESPEFEALETTDSVAQSPLREALKERTNRHLMLQIFGMCAVQQVGYYVVLTYLEVYATQIGFSATFASLSATITLAVTVVVMPFMGALSDRIGRKPLLIGSSLFFLIFGIPVFMVLSTADAVVFVLVQAMLGIVVAAFNGVTTSAFPEMLPVRTRMGMYNVPYGVAAALFGGPALYVSTWLITVTGDNRAPVLYVLFAAIITLIALSKVTGMATRSSLAASRAGEPVPQEIAK